MQVDRKLGFLLLAVWLILTGLSQLVSLNFQYEHVILGALAVGSGVVLILRR